MPATWSRSRPRAAPASTRSSRSATADPAMPAPATTTFLLPAAARLGRQRLSGRNAALLGRGRRGSDGEAGRRAQLLRHFPLHASGWPIAALARQAEVGDAADAAWLRADPAWLRPDINGVRLFAHGEALAVTEDERDGFLSALRPLFGDAGFALDAPHPAHWYLRLPAGTPLPAFPDPGDALGEDLFDHLDTGPEGRRWRALASEAQVLLHNHPLNARRVARGQAPVNAVWFWGRGRPPAAPAAGARWRARRRCSCTTSRSTPVASPAARPRSMPCGAGAAAACRRRPPRARVRTCSATTTRRARSRPPADGPRRCPRASPGPAACTTSRARATSPGSNLHGSRRRWRPCAPGALARWPWTRATAGASRCAAAICGASGAARWPGPARDRRAQAAPPPAPRGRGRRRLARRS